MAMREQRVRSSIFRLFLLFFSKANLLEADVWKEFLARPSLPYVLRLLSGLCKGHANTQVQWSDRSRRWCTDVICK